MATSTTGPLQTPQQASTPIVRPEQTCQTSETVVQGRDKICKGTLIFSDEFEKNSLKDLTSWGAEVRFPEEPVSVISVQFVSVVLFAIITLFIALR